MNTTAKTLIQALIAGVVLATGATLMLIKQPEPSKAVVQLERVVITAKRAQSTQIAELPRVVVTGKRVESNPGALVAMVSRIAAKI